MKQLLKMLFEYICGLKYSHTLVDSGTKLFGYLTFDYDRHMWLVWTCRYPDMCTANDKLQAEIYEDNDYVENDTIITRAYNRAKELADSF